MTTKKDSYHTTAFASHAGSTGIYHNAIQFVIASRLRLVSGDQIATELISEMGEYSDARIEDEIRGLAKAAIARRWPEVWLY